MEVPHVQVESVRRNCRKMTCTRCGKTDQVSESDRPKKPLLRERGFPFRIWEERLSAFKEQHKDCPEGFHFGQDRRYG